MESYYLTALRNCLAHRHSRDTGRINRREARELICSIRAERNGKGRAIRAKYLA